jgi:hypothetical protein
MNRRSDFNPLAFLSTIGDGRVMLPFEKNDGYFRSERFFGRTVFHSKGKVRLSVVSESGQTRRLKKVINQRSGILD